jgi:hypothetical protein
MERSVRQKQRRWEGKGEAIRGGRSLDWRERERKGGKGHRGERMVLYSGEVHLVN